MSQIYAREIVSQNLDYEHLCLEDPFLVLEKQYLSRCVSIVDIVDSTFITAKLSPEQAGKYYMVFYHFHLKYEESLNAAHWPALKNN